MWAEALHLRASASLAVAAVEKGTRRAQLLRAAARDAGKLRGMRWDLATAFAHMVDAGTASLRGDRDRAARELDSAHEGCTALDMHLHAALIAWQLGKLRGGAEGAAATGRAETWMRAEGIVDLEATAEVLVPGFRR
jgi:hypothetical protein